MIPALLTLLSIVVAISLVAYLLSPLRQHGSALEAVNDGSGELSPERSDSAATLLEEREVALAGLAELDFDRNLGNLSEEDYQNLRGHYRAQALQILKSLDADAPGEITPRAVGAQADRADRAQPSTVRVPALGAMTSDISGRKAGAGIAIGTGIGIRTGARAGTGTTNAGPLDRRALSLILGVVATALVAVALWVVWLRGAGSPSSSSENAPPLNIMHAHAALLVPGTNVALVGHHNGLLRSMDDGINWLPVAGLTGDVLSVVSDEAARAGETAGATIFLATSDKVMSSRDVGSTWQSIAPPRSGGPIEALAGGDGKPTLLYAYVTGAGLYSTADLQRWETAGSELNTVVAAMSLRPGPLAALYAASPEEGVLASGDEGRTWGSANGTLNGVLATLAVRSLTFDAASGDRFTGADGTQLVGAIYAGTDVGLFKTIDGGSSWVPMPLREPLSAISARSKPASLILAIDGHSRVWRSTDRGNTWNPGNTRNAGGSAGSAGTGVARP